MSQHLSLNSKKDTESSPEPQPFSRPLNNAPGQTSLRYRCGLYETFYQAMLDRLATERVGEETVPPLAPLTTRDQDDPTIALLDCWAMVGDVLTFYQERIANEGFLRTATERRSVLELARAIGYEFSPGVAASVPLAFTIDPSLENPAPVTIPKGTRVQSIPAQSEAPQTFETIETIEARAAWNALSLRLTEPQTIKPETTSLKLVGASLPIEPGQPLLLDGPNATPDPIVRLAHKVTPDAEKDVTTVTWDGQMIGWDNVKPKVSSFRERIPIFGYNAPPYLDPPAPNAITCLAVSPDGTEALTGYADGTIRHWTISNGESTVLPKVHTAMVTSIAFSPTYPSEPKHCLSTSVDGRIVLWEIDGKARAVLNQAFSDDEHHHIGAVNCAIFSPDYANDRQILSGGADRQVIWWKLAVGFAAIEHSEPLLTEDEYNGPVQCVAFSPGFTAEDGNALSGDGRGKLILWTWASGKASHKVLEVAVQSPEPVEGGVRLRQAQPTWGSERLLLEHESLAEIRSVAFSPEYSSDNQFLTGGADGQLFLWESTTAKMILTGHTGVVNRVAFSSNYAQDRQILSTATDNKLILWTLNVESGEATPQILNGPRTSVNGVAYTSGDGRSALATTIDERLIVWDLSTLKPQQVMPPLQAHDEWPDFDLNDDTLDLAVSETKLVPGDQIILLDQQNGLASQICVVDHVTTKSMNNVFGLTAKAISLSLRQTLDPGFSRRTTDVWAIKQAHTLAEAMLPDKVPVYTTELTLAEAVNGLQSGQLIALSGLDSDGLPQGEMLTIEKIDGNTLTFQDPLKGTYQRASVRLNANVAQATHGETVQQVLGSGEGAQPNQVFTLAQHPLTYVSAVASRGSQSTLRVWVNQVEWQEANAPNGLSPNSPSFLVRQDEAGQSHLIFGDGEQGRRLPAGSENVTAAYRVGVGLAGKVAAGSLTSLQNQPPSVSAVTNPVDAGGAAPPDTRDAARLKAPLTVSTLNRIVALRDYEDFALTFAGIGRVRVSQLIGGDKHTRTIHLTIIGADQDKIGEDSLLYQSLVNGIEAARSEDQAIKVQSGQLIHFTIAATILVLPHYQPAPIQARIEERLRTAFHFDQRHFGQDVAVSDVIANIQQVDGVQAVRELTLQAVPTLGGITLTHEELQPAKWPPSNGARLSLNAALAQWDATTDPQAFKPDQLLILDPKDGLDLKMDVI